MEDVLDLHGEPYDARYPVVNFDESSKQLVAELREPLPAHAGDGEKPGALLRYDTQYRRNGTCNLFMFCEPHAGWRHIEVTERRTKADFAHQMRWLADQAYPEAIRIRVVLDNLNTHNPTSLYETFAPEEARRILKKLEFHHTPKHGSWLNMAEIEFSVLSRTGLNRRIPNRQTLEREVLQYEQRRNLEKAPIHWTFTCASARTKLKRLYPDITG